MISFPSRPYGDDVAVVELPGKTIILVGTAHISRQSADLVSSLIEQERPDTVCVELDVRRHEALANPNQWRELDLRQVIRKKQLSTLIVNLILASYQKKLGGQLGVMPGVELLAAANKARDLGIAVSLCDRDVRVTLRRAWKATSLWKKGYLLASLAGSLFDSTEMSEEKLADLRNKDVLSGLMAEISATLPGAKQVLIDERDQYMAAKIKAAEGKRIVAVVGAGHVAGIQRMLMQDNADSLEALDSIPPVSPGWKIVGWSIPVFIVLSLFLIGIRQGAGEAGSNVLYWILANGIPSAIGGMLALAHPLTILSAFAAAPITSLTPLIGAGYVCAFIQVMKKPPMVWELENVGTDMGRFTGWWRNRLLRIFLVFFLTGLGSSIGTYVGGYRIVTSLLS